MTTLNLQLPKGIALGIAFAIMGGCLSSGDDSETADNPGGGNSAPSISGNPNTSTTVGNSYSFTPSASDPDGDSLSFSLQNKPAWASFASATGRLSGTPGDADAGTYAGISITVSDGSLSASLPSFDITVEQVSMGSATLSWTPPTQNTDGSSLDDLAGYRIYYGVSQGSYLNRIPIDNPGLTSYVVDNLSPDTYYFVSTSVNSSGVESTYSNVATKTVN